MEKRQSIELNILARFSTIYKGSDGTTASFTQSLVSTKNNSVSWKLSNAKASKNGATALAM